MNIEQATEQFLGLCHENGFWATQEEVAKALRCDAFIETSRVATDHEIPTGASKFGGVPDLPAQFAWPYYRLADHDVLLSFLGQINLADIPSQCNRGVLPRTGLLTLWFDAIHQPWGTTPEDDGGFQVSLTPSGTTLLRMEPSNTPGETFHPCIAAISARYILDRDKLWAAAHTRLGYEIHDDHEFEDLWIALSEYCPDPTHRILGIPDPIQDDELLLTTMQHVGEPCVLLAQIDSDHNDDGPGWMWEDAGSLYFMIRETDLRAGEYSRIVGRLECY